MKPLFLLLAIIHFGCETSTRQAPEATATDVPKIALEDSSLIETPPREAKEIVPKQSVIPSDSKGGRVFIDRVETLETGEPYVWVAFKDEYDWKMFDVLKGLTDSVMYHNGDIKRRRLPMQSAQQYLDLELLDGITIFNYKHQRLGVSQLKRIEYFEDMIGDQFIALLEMGAKFPDGKYYGINGIDHFVSGLESSVVEDPDLEDAIKEHIGLSSKYHWEFTSTVVYPYNRIYSHYSFVAEADGEKSFLLASDIATRGVKIMTEVTNGYSIWDLVPVPVQVNKRPVLLLWVGPPETDIEWYIPAVFDGEQFQVAKDRIIDLSSFGGSVTDDSLKCSSEVLVATSRKLEELVQEDVDVFLRTFSSDCDVNAEFSEWSNELLYDILYLYPSEVVKSLSEPEGYDLPVILREIETPVNDKYDPTELIASIEELSANPAQEAVLRALQTAQRSYE